MPPGIPVGAVGLDRGDNAALLAIEILSINDKKLKKELENYREKLREKALSK
jgi:5-(carboxyamino)imidazole ribonucleotide mutase